MMLDGVFVANVTPFSPSGTLDEEALKRHLQFLAEAGVHGFVPCGTTGESPTLSAEERRRVIAAAREAAAPKGLKVIAGCGGNATDKVLELTREAADLGADAALVVCPYYNKPTPAGLMRHFTFLADESPIPLVLYNIPPRTIVGLTPAMVADLFAHPRIVGVKEATGNFSQWMELAERCDLSKKSVLAGDDNAFAPILALGGKGIISASANVLPEAFVALYAAAAAGDLPGAFRRQISLNAAVRALFRETNPAPVKWALHLRNGLPPALRLPLVEVGAETKEAVSAALKGLELIS